MGLRMRFEIVQLDPNVSVTFVIGTRERPDTEMKDQIREQIETAMDHLSRPRESYSISVIQDRAAFTTPETGSAGLEFEPHTTYICFAIADSSDSMEPLSDRELADIRRELADSIIPPAGSRISLVVLRDSRVSVLRSREYMPVFMD